MREDDDENCGAGSDDGGGGRTTTKTLNYRFRLTKNVVGICGWDATLLHYCVQFCFSSCSLMSL